MKDTGKNLFDQLFGDDSFRELRRAYHELEAFQLSEEHLAARELLKNRISQQTRQPEPSKEAQ